MIDQRFGRLVVLRRYDGPSKSVSWVCCCDCGTEKSFIGYLLRSGNTKSCGCLRKEVARATRTTHGRSRTPIYWVWQRMIQRCSNPNTGEYQYYGARGISVCNRWRDSFEDFIADMGERPHGMTIERKDNSGNYEPGNCIWVFHETQMNNMNSNRILEFKGREQTIARWAREVGIKQTTLYMRINAGWSVERALTQPTR